MSLASEIGARLRALSARIEEIAAMEPAVTAAQFAALQEEVEAMRNSLPAMVDSAVTALGFAGVTANLADRLSTLESSMRDVEAAIVEIGKIEDLGPDAGGGDGGGDQGGGDGGYVWPDPRYQYPSEPPAGWPRDDHGNPFPVDPTSGLALDPATGLPAV